jgi:hypothetical protein
MKKLFLVIGIIAFLFSCEKEISIKLPDAEIKPVVEGKIEPNRPPIIILTKNMGYFSATTNESLNQLFIHDAQISMQSDVGTFNLTEYCISDIPDTLMPYLVDFFPYLSSISGIPLELISSIDFCIYTTINPQAWGEYGKTYKLSITNLNKTYSASTSIPQPIALDSLWFKPKSPTDSLGYVWAKLSDPPSSGNCYRWFAKRLYKDNAFLAPRNSSFDDKFVNGKTFDFGYTRARVPGSTKEEDNNQERGAYKVNDTVVVKFCTIDAETFAFIDDFEANTSSGGNPFGAPSTIKSNIQGGALGYWGGYGVSYDTLIIKSSR